MSAARKPRRPPPDLLDPLTAADRAADAWLRARGEPAWRWPRVQGAQPRGGAEDDERTSKCPDVQINSASPDLRVEAAQTLAALRAGGMIDAAGRRTAAAAPPATCGDSADDAPALPAAAAAAALGCCVRTVQTKARRLHDAEREGQLVLPCVPPVAEVYAARPLVNANSEAIHGC